MIVTEKVFNNDPNVTKNITRPSTIFINKLKLPYYMVIEMYETIRNLANKLAMKDLQAHIDISGSRIYSNERRNMLSHCRSEQKHASGLRRFPASHFRSGRGGGKPCTTS